MRTLAENEKKFLAQINTARTYQPLDVLELQLPSAGIVGVRDARGEEYFREKAKDKVSVTISGALGNHFIDWMDEEGQVTAHAVIRVDCETSIVDEGSFWEHFHQKLYWNIHALDEYDRKFDAVRYEGNTYFLLSSRFRDSINIAKGKRYYYSHMKDVIDLFAVTQTGEGMIYDFYTDHPGPRKGARFRNRKFIKTTDLDTKCFIRFPLSNDVEALFVQGLYLAWKATGDILWMTTRLANAEKALRYNMESEYCWSKKYLLIKRVLSVDTWDFSSEDEARMFDGDPMEAVPGKSRFGIFHGDNTSFALSCEQFAEMCNFVGDADKATHWRGIAKKIREQLDKISWNGRFFTHWIPEDDSFVGDFDVDMKAQISMSNVNALNRGISHEQAVAIINTYLDLRKNMDPAAPAEFYSMYPPFKTGFRFLGWHYVNGGVWPFVGGELAHGAFEHGYEKYGVDILRRLSQMLPKDGDKFPSYWIGRTEPEPARTFTTIDLTLVANVDISGMGARGVPGWESRGTDNDFSCMPVGKRSYFNVPFSIVDPSLYGRRCCIGMGSQKGYSTETVVEVNAKAASIYFLHTLAAAGNVHLVGWLDFLYADGSTSRKYVEVGKHLRNWWYPYDVPYSETEGWVCRVAFQGENHHANVGNFIWGHNNPYPEKEIRSIKITHSRPLSHFWFIFGITLSDAPVWFEAPATVQQGRFYNWNASGMVYGLVEGLCGVYDAGACFDKALIAPRWAATDSKQVKVFVKYPGSQGYVAYNFVREKSRIVLDFTTPSGEVTLKVLLPEDQEVDTVLLSELPVPFTLETVEKSNYVVLQASEIKAKKLSIELKSAQPAKQ